MYRTFDAAVSPRLLLELGRIATINTTRFRVIAIWVARTVAFVCIALVATAVLVNLSLFAAAVLGYPIHDLGCHCCISRKFGSGLWSRWWTPAVGLLGVAAHATEMAISRR